MQLSTPDGPRAGAAAGLRRMTGLGIDVPGTPVSGGRPGRRARNGPRGALSRSHGEGHGQAAPRGPPPSPCRPSPPGSLGPPPSPGRRPRHAPRLRSAGRHRRCGAWPRGGRPGFVDDPELDAVRQGARRDQHRPPGRAVLDRVLDHVGDGQPAGVGCRRTSQRSARSLRKDSDVQPYGERGLDHI